jgi:hypothetical protein
MQVKFRFEDPQPKIYFHLACVSRPISAFNQLAVSSAID